MYKDLKKLSDSLRANGAYDEADAILKIAIDYAGTDAASCEDFEFEDEGYRWKYVCIPFGFKFQLLKNLARNTDLSRKNIFFEEGSRAYESLDSRREEWVGQVIKPPPSDDIISHSPDDYPEWQRSQPPGTEWPTAEEIISKPEPTPPTLPFRHPVQPERPDRARSRRRTFQGRRNQAPASGEAATPTASKTFSNLEPTDENTKNIIFNNIPGSRGGTRVAIKDGGEGLWNSLLIRDSLPDKKAFYVLVTENRDCYRSEKSTLFMIGESGNESNRMFHVSHKFIDLVSGSRKSLERYLGSTTQLSTESAALMSESQMNDAIYKTYKQVRTPIRRLPFRERMRCGRELKMQDRIRGR